MYPYWRLLLGPLIDRALILSPIFSHTNGTPKKRVGVATPNLDGPKATRWPGGPDRGAQRGSIIVCTYRYITI